MLRTLLSSGFSRTRRFFKAMSPYALSWVSATSQLYFAFDQEMGGVSKDVRIERLERKLMLLLFDRTRDAN